MREQLTRRKFAAVRMNRDEMHLRRVLFLLGLVTIAGALFFSFLPFELRGVTVRDALDRFFGAPGIDPVRAANDQWVGHTLAYGVIAFLLGAALLRGGPLRQILGASIVVFICAALSVFAEIGQAFIVARGVAGNDVAAGIVGGIVGVTVWGLFGRDLMRLWIEAGSGDGDQALRAGAVLYAVAYGLFLLFPFDFALSWHGLADLARDGKPFLGLGAGEDVRARASMRLLFEVVAAAPVGFLMVHWVGPRALVRVVAVALAVGFGTEIIQYAIQSAQSTLPAAITRSAGVVAGWWLMGTLRGVVARHPDRYADGGRRFDQGRLRLVLKLLTLGMLPVYLLALVAVDGWGRGAPIGIGEAMDRLRTLHWLPFFYHRETDEVTALVNSLATIAMFIPAGLVVWVLRGISVRRPVGVVAAVFAIMLSALLEFGGLLFAGFRPDPTDLWLGGLGGAIGGAGGVALWRWLTTAFLTPGGADRPTTEALTDRASSGDGSFAVRHFIALLIPLLVGLLILDFPAANGWILAALLAYGIFLWRHPVAWLVMVPALLPVLDLSSLTGRNFIDIFDMVLLVTVAVLLVRRPPRWWDMRMGGVTPWIMGLFVLAFGMSVLSGIFPLPPAGPDFWVSPWSQMQSLLVAKGLFWAVVLYPFLARFIKNDPGALLLLANGIAAGLALTVVVVLWERFLFPGLFTVNTSYRVLGAFTTMRTGGAHIDSYLIMALPFLAVLVMASRDVKVRMLALCLLVGGLYAVFATFSRGPYVVVMGTAVVLALGLWVASRHRPGGIARLIVFGLLGLGIAGAATVPFVSGSFLADRFERLFTDRDIRMDHWAHTRAMMDENLATTLVGMGPGRFPAVYREQSLESLPYFRLGEEGDDGYLSWPVGGNLFVQQFVRIRPHTGYRLTLRARAWNDNARLRIHLCEKWVTQSYDCIRAVVRIGDTDGEWQTFETRINTGTVGGAKGRSGWISARPVKLALSSPPRGERIDITSISLIDPMGPDRIDNGGFDRGLDFWYHSADNLLAWNIDNLFVSLLFDQGVLGLALFALLMGGVLARLVRQTFMGERFSAVLLAALLGLLVIGLIGSPFDAPRLSLMFYLLVFTALLTGELMRPSGHKDRAADVPGPAQDGA